MKRHFPAMRGLAIVLVVLNHSVYMSELYRSQAGFGEVSDWTQYILLIFLALGFLAVPTFLFISGSFFAYVAQGDRSRLSFQLVFKNLDQIVFPYIVWSIVFYAVLYLGHQETYSPLGYVKNLLVGYPFNFVPLIVFFYLASPILVWLMDRIGWFPLLLGIGLYQALLIMIVFPDTIPVTLPAWTHYLAPPVLATTLADWAIYFPLGLMYSLNMKQITPWLEKLRWPLVATTIFTFAVTLLHGAHLIYAPWIRYLFPLSFMLLVPLFQRKSIPYVRQLESVGKYAYGIYLIHLSLLDATLLVIIGVAPSLLQYTLLIMLFLFTIGLYLPLILMQTAARLQNRRFYRFVFG